MSDLRERLAEALTNLVFASSATRAERADAILAADPAIERTYQRGLDAEATIQRLREALEAVLSVAEPSYDGDSWYAASDDGGAGIGYDECERRLQMGRTALADTAPEGER